MKLKLFDFRKYNGDVRRVGWIGEEVCRDDGYLNGGLVNYFVVARREAREPS